MKDQPKTASEIADESGDTIIMENQNDPPLFRGIAMKTESPMREENSQWAKIIQNITEVNEEISRSLNVLEGKLTPVRMNYPVDPGSEPAKFDGAPLEEMLHQIFMESETNLRIIQRLIHEVQL